MKMAQIYSFAREDEFDEELPQVNSYTYDDYMIVDALGDNHVLSISFPKEMKPPSEEDTKEILEHFDMLGFNMTFQVSSPEEKIIYYIKG